MVSAGSSRRQVPFGGHQLAEYALAAALVVVGMHLGGRPAIVLAVAGAVVGAFAFVSQGPLAAVRIIPRRLHVYLDLVLAAGFAASPLLYLHNLQIIPIVLSEAVAVLLVRMSLTTEIVPLPTGQSAASVGRRCELQEARILRRSLGGCHDGWTCRGDRSRQGPWLRRAADCGAQPGASHRPGPPLGVCRSREQDDYGLGSACSCTSGVVRAI